MRARNVDGTFVMSYLILPGQRFGRLIVIERAPNNKNSVMWLCQCDCGTIKITWQSLLNAGHAQSCGCLRREVSAARVRTHGKRRSAIYGLWCAMKSRCLHQKNDFYADYGGRGITVCERWMKFENFYEDMGDRPEGKSLERRNNSAGYSPENCYWATTAEQGRNKRNTVMLTAFGKTMTQAEWARAIGVHDSVIFRVTKRRGRTLEQFIERRGYVERAGL